MTDLVKVTYTGGPSADWYSRFYLDRTLSSTAQDSVDTVKNFFTTLRTAITDNVTMHVDPVVTVVSPTTGEPTGLEQVTGYTITGAVSNDPLPLQTQGLIYWNTGVWIGGRQIRGRTFIPGPCEDANDGDGNPVSGYLSTLASAASGFVTPADGQPAIFSRLHHNMYPIVSANVSTRWALMRTRR